MLEKERKRYLCPENKPIDEHGWLKTRVKCTATVDKQIPESHFTCLWKQIFRQYLE